MRFFKTLYIKDRFFYILTGIILLFILSFIFPVIFGLVKGLLVLVLVVFLIDIILLYAIKNGIVFSRKTPDRFSNGDRNNIYIEVQNRYGLHINIEIIDEVPFQFQKRDFLLSGTIAAKDFKTFEYFLRPTSRGKYDYGKLNIYVSSVLGLVSKRYMGAVDVMVPTYPSFLQMRKYELMAFTNKLQTYGMKRIKRIGHSSEFDQIREYVIGDDMRHVNWKATAKKSDLMVNQYQDERSQPVYSIIDKGRVMKMPFDGLSLLDYAINASLVMSNIALLKHDKAGMLTFSNKIENKVAAERRSAQMQLIMDNLYHVSSDFKETDFGRLYKFVKTNITHRSLLMIYTNFETMDGLNRQIKYIKALSKLHLVVVIFFKNSELDTILEKEAKSELEVYDKSVAEKFEYEKRQIVLALHQYGVHTVLTRPENLTADSINKYLELKARGLF